MDGIRTVEDLERVVSRYHGYLWTLAFAGLGTGFRNQLEPGDLVQATLVRAIEAFDQFGGGDERSLLAWLRAILTHVLLDEHRRLHRGKRNIELEQQALSQCVDKSAAGLEAWLAAEQTSPSQAATRSEQLLRLADALAHLPDDQRQAVVLKYLQGRDLQSIANEMARTVPAVAGLLRRGLTQLRELLPEE